MLRVRVPRIAVTEVTGNANITLDSFTLVSTASLLIRGNSNITLDPVTVSSTGRLSIMGSLSKTLDDFTLSANGELFPPSANAIAEAVWNYILEGSVSAGQMLTGVTRTQLARVDINETTGQVTIYKLDGTTIFAQASTSPTGDRNAPTVDWS